MERLGGFRPYIKKQLPTVYDDTLSYYEILTSVIGFLNQVIDQGNSLADYSEETRKQLLAEHKKLKDHMADVERWLRDEALPVNIAEKLGNMYDSGQLAEIINKDVFNMKVDTEQFLQHLQDIELFKTKFADDLNTFKTSVDTDLNTFKTSVDTDLNTFKTSVDTDLNTFKTSVDERIETVTKRLSSKIKVHMFNTTRKFTFDCFLIQIDGINVMVDFGMHGDVPDIANQMNGLGVTKIHYAYITHYHSDHIGGLSRFLTETHLDFSQCKFYIPPQADWNRVNTGTTGSTGAFLRDVEIGVRSDLNTLASGYTIMQDGMTINFFDNCSLTFYNVGETYWNNYYDANYTDGTHSSPTDYNDFSIMGLIKFNDSHILLTSDIGYTAQGLNSKNVPESLTLYQIPHHGLDKNIHPLWLKAIDTEFAFISNNRTDGSVTSRYEYSTHAERGVGIYSGFHSGTVTFTKTMDSSNVKSQHGLVTENHNQYSLTGSKLIDLSDDLNDYVKSGMYVSDTVERTASLINLPEGLTSGFKMRVEFYHHDSRRRQTIYEVAGRGYIYYRTFSTNNQWNPWHRLMTDRDFIPGDGSVSHRFSEGADLNSFMSVGKYASDTATLTATLLNKPTALTAGFTLEVIPLYDAQRFHQEIRVNNGACDVFRRAYTGSWNPWFRVMTERADL